ncbi:22514_t:CDS:2 [Rhizophagus irregularis]|nr:22514_t:CDS:2 [Rhizophagus irregularis]
MSKIEYVSHYFLKSAGITTIYNGYERCHFRNNTKPNNTFWKPTRSYDFQYRLTFNSTCENNCFYTPRGFKDCDKYLAEFFLQDSYL